MMVPNFWTLYYQTSTDATSWKLSIKVFTDRHGYISKVILIVFSHDKFPTKQVNPKVGKSL
jgi:hypothetical protein